MSDLRSAGDTAKSFHCYLIPSELSWELPVEQIILVQTEILVDQSVLREREGGRGRQRRLTVRRRRIKHKQAEKQ